jgi:hypothetical protein
MIMRHDVPLGVLKSAIRALPDRKTGARKFHLFCLVNWVSLNIPVNASLNKNALKRG